MEEPKDLPPLPEIKTEPRWVDPKVVRKVRKKLIKRRRRHAMVPLLLGPLDSAVVLRGNGRVQVVHARGEIVVGGSNFWGLLMGWLFAKTEDADERRKILVEDFMADLAEKRAELAAKQAKEAAEKAPEPAAESCPCGEGSPASFEGPLRDCPVHGEAAVPPENAT